MSRQRCTIENMDNQKCHAYNNGECMNSIVCKDSRYPEAKKYRDKAEEVTNMRDITKLITAGNKAQIEKLEKYNHKPGFDNISFVDSFNGLINEVKELAEAFQTPEVNKQGYRNIRHEAADVANFAHMIILACDKELAK